MPAKINSSLSHVFMVPPGEALDATVKSVGGRVLEFLYPFSLISLLLQIVPVFFLSDCSAHPNICHVWCISIKEQLYSKRDVGPRKVLVLALN